MLYCKSCKVDVGGIHEHCPLCGGNLAGTPEENRSYPLIQPDTDRMTDVIKFISIAALSGAIACVAINMLVASYIWWSLFAVFGLACGWIWAVVGIKKKENLLNNIVWQLIILSALAVLWDVFTGWRGWSIDYVFPSICIGAMLAVIILSRVLRLPDRDYIIYLVVDAVMGIIPLIFILTGILHVTIPSVISVAVSLIVISMLLIFYWKAMYREISRKLHL